MGVNTINVTSTIFGLAIQYDRLDALCNRAFRNFNGKTINIFIDLYTIFKELRKKHIIVRYFNAPRINQYLRVTIGNDEEMDAFLDAVKEIIQAS